MIRLIKIAGNSLEPKYKEGGYLVIATHPLIMRTPKPGDIIVFRHPVYDTMVKQIQRVDFHEREIFVIGTHPNSTDSRQFGPIPKEWVTGKVLWYILKPG